jgi:hypothetical protein
MFTETTSQHQLHCLIQIDLPKGMYGVLFSKTSAMYAPLPHKKYYIKNFIEEENNKKAATMTNFL